MLDACMCMYTTSIHVILITALNKEKGIKEDDDDDEEGSTKLRTDQQ